MIITKKQWILIAVIVAVMVVDVVITLYGVWFQHGNFYEANPLFAMVGILNTPETFTIGLILIKTIGINQDYNFLIKKMEYKIIINKDLEEKYMLTNGVFKFLDFDLRNKKLKELKDKLKDFIKII